MLRLLEEILPFIVYYCINRPKLIAAAKDSELVKDGGPLSSYRDLEEGTIESRLKEEHDRARLIDEKTVKFTLTSSLALTLLSSTSTYILKTVPLGEYLPWPIALSGVSVLYMLIGGLISLEALITLPRYGYGTCFLIKAKNDRDIRIHALAAQEKVNDVRHCRNEAAFQCIRNGLLLLIVSFSITLAGLFFDFNHVSEQEEARTTLQGSHSVTPQPNAIPQVGPCARSKQQ